MPKFIEIQDNLIKVDNIVRVEFITDDIYLGLFPCNEEGKALTDYISFTFAKIYTSQGEIYEMNLPLYYPEDEESEEGWIKINRSRINKSMDVLRKAIGNITLVDLV